MVWETPAVVDRLVYSRGINAANADSNMVFGLCDNSRSGLCQLFMTAAHCAGKCMQQVWFWELVFQNYTAALFWQ